VCVCVCVCVCVYASAHDKMGTLLTVRSFSVKFDVWGWGGGGWAQVARHTQRRQPVCNI